MQNSYVPNSQQYLVNAKPGTNHSSGGFKGGGRAGSGPPFGRRTDAVTVLLISENGSVLWRPIVS